MTSDKLFAFLVYMLMMWLLTGCTVTEQPLSEPPAALLGRWELVGAGCEACDMFLPNPAAWVMFSAESGDIGYTWHGFSGCNDLSGSYTAADDRLMLVVGQTKKGCEGDLMGFEAYMVNILSNQPQFLFKEGMLTLQLSADDRLIFVSTAP